MPNDSSTGGFLAPLPTPAPIEDAALDAALQVAVAGITGISGSLVRPRWQPGSPKQPEPGVNWCAIGVTTITPDAGPFIRHVGTGSGNDNYARHEELELACSFYGPAAGTNAALLRDGLGIPQNLETLSAAGLAFIDCSDAVAMPELFNQQWIKRVDLTVTFRRQVQRTFAIRNILSADPILISDEIGIIAN